MVCNTYVVGEISVHKDDVVSSAFAKAIDVGTAEAHLSGAPVQDNLVTVYLLEFADDVLRTVWRVVVDDYNFHVDVAAKRLGNAGMRVGWDLLLLRALHEEPDDERQIFTLFVGGHEDGVFLSVPGFGGVWCGAFCH
jgi:hypothetical protein